MSRIDRILVLDTETAGLVSGVVEIAWYEIDDQLKILDRVRALINPEQPISAIASGVHGLVDDDVKDCPTLREFMAGKFAAETVLLIGHNISFDIRFVKAEFGDVDGLCTLKLARLVYPDAPDHKLQTLMHHLKLTRAGNHNALDDVNTSYELLMRMGEELNMSLQDLYALAKRPTLVAKMPFGKHKGTKLSSLLPAYVKWLLTLDNLDDNLRYSLEQL